MEDRERDRQFDLDAAGLEATEPAGCGGRRAFKETSEGGLAVSVVWC